MSKNQIRWSIHEIEFLKKYYPIEGPQYCANALGRPVTGIHRKAQKLNIKTIHSGGFNPEMLGTLYFVSFLFENKTYYKLGITNQTTRQRLKADWNKLSFKIEWEIQECGQKIRKMERELLTKNSHLLHNTKALTNGNSETFSVYIEKPKELK